MNRTSTILAAGAALLLLAACDEARTTTADTGEAERPAATTLSDVGDRLQEAIGGAVEATRDAAGEAGSAIREEIGRIDSRELANAIRAVGQGFEAAGRLVAEAAERAAANLEGRAEPEVQETARTEPERTAAQ